jgi:uncharacterized protein
MSAAQPKSSEPSMEEILASIRRIISDEPAKPEPAVAAEAPAPTPAPSPPPVAPASPPVVAAAPSPPDDDDDEVMELKPKVKIPEPHFIADDPVDNDLSFADPVPEQLPKSQDDIDALMNAAMAEEPAPAPAAAPEPPPAVSPPVVLPPVALPPASFAPPATPQPPAERLISAEADRAASAAFASLTNTVLSKNARTLDDLMQEMLRPMIKTWLDDNLPTVVERLVRAEIERVARGGR